MTSRRTAYRRGALVHLAIGALALGGCAALPQLTDDGSNRGAAAVRPAVSPPDSGPTLFASEAPPARSIPRVTPAQAQGEPDPHRADAGPGLSPADVSLAGAPTPEKKDPEFKLRGRIEADAITVSQSPKNKALFGDFENAVGFRRARLGAEGTAGEQVRWVAEFDFAGGDVALKDVFVAVRHLPVVGEVRVGQFQEPFSLEAQTPSTAFPFTEYSPAATLDPFLNWGVGFFSHTDDQRLFVQAGAFRSGTDSAGTDIGDGNDWAYTARVVGLAWYEECGGSLSLLHVGGAASQRYAKDNTVTFNQGPQSSLLQTGTDSPRTPFVPTVSIPANQYQLYNLQAALVLGPLSFQADWNAARVEQTGGGPVFLSGWYVFASYFLTGEHRGYDREVGTFRGPTVRRPFACTDRPGVIAQGPGAWEVRARLAYLDFDSPNLPRGANGLPVGTRTTTITLGLNWYLNDNARIMFDWDHAIPNLPPFGSSTADIVTVRTAVFW